MNARPSDRFGYRPIGQLNPTGRDIAGNADKAARRAPKLPVPVRYPSAAELFMSAIRPRTSCSSRPFRRLAAPKSRSCAETARGGPWRADRDALARWRQALMTNSWISPLVRASYRSWSPQLYLLRHCGRLGEVLNLRRPSPRNLSGCQCVGIVEQALDEYSPSPQRPARVDMGSNCRAGPGPG